MMIRRALRSLALTAAAIAGLTTVGHATDGVIEINQARALAGGVTPADTAGFPVTISQPGSYRLTSNLDIGTSPGIIISAANVTIDLNGFTISGNGACNICGEFGHATILNGMVRVTEQSQAILLGLDSRVEGVHLTNGSSLVVGPHSIVTRCIIDGSFFGIVVGDGSLVSFNTVYSTGGPSILYTGTVGFIGNNLNHFPSGTGDLIQLGPNICGNSLCP